MKKYSRIQIILFICTLNFLFSQSIKISPDPGFNPFLEFFITSLNLTTGESDTYLFGYRIFEENNDYSSNIEISVEYELILESNVLGDDSPVTIIRVSTQPFILQAPVRISNLDMMSLSSVLYDMESNRIELSGNSINALDFSTNNILMNTFLSTGKLIDGTYNFTFSVLIDGIVADKVVEKFVASSPIYIDLITPGGEISDTTFNWLHDQFPVFYWETGFCFGCEIFIRVSEFNPKIHHSPDDAIEDITVLPISQYDQWYKVDQVPFQYPTVGAIPLMDGKVYVWQIKAENNTNMGTESILSPVNAFKYNDYSSLVKSAAETIHPLLQQVRDVIGNDPFEVHFGKDASLDGYAPSGEYEINNETVSMELIEEILSKLEKEKPSLKFEVK